MVTQMQKPSQKPSPKGSTLDSYEDSLQANLEQENQLKGPSTDLTVDIAANIAVDHALDLANCCQHELIVAALIAENDQLKAENDTLRARIGDQDDEIERLNQEVNYRNESADRNRQLIGWMLDLFRNKSIPAACKLVLFYFHFQFFMMRPNTADETMRIGVEECAKAIGMSTSTVRSSTNKHQEFGVLNREYHPYTTENGEKRTYVDITLNSIADTPLAIQMENNHGGARVAVCPVCKEATDNYTVRYCRCCNENRWYGQPGLSSDADVSKAMEAPNYPGHEKVQKHLAFNENEPQPAQLSSRIDSAIATIDAAQPSQEVETKFPAVEQPFRRSKKQDAFDQGGQAHHILKNEPAQLATEPNTPNYRVKLPQIEQKTVSCKAKVPVNKQGKPAGALDSIVSYRECGCTDWQWSEDDQQRVCAKCWTPQQQKG